VEVTPYSGMYEWYSGMGAWVWTSFYQTFDIPDTGATLNFWVNYDIEEDWDYGYVEVYDYDTDSWTTLDDTTGYTTELLLFAQQNENCLLYTSPSPRDATLSRMPSSA